MADAANPGATSEARVQVLFLCTANQVRSPFACAVARSIAAREQLPIEFSSAGLMEGGAPAAESIVRIATKSGLDLEGHVSRRVTAEMADSADIVVAMTGAHVVDLSADFPDLLGRAITLREAARATETLGPPEWSPPRVREWTTEVARRPLSALLSPAVDIADPAGQSRRAYRRAAEQISHEVECLLIAH